MTFSCCKIVYIAKRKIKFVQKWKKECVHKLLKPSFVEDEHLKPSFAEDERGIESQRSAI